DGPSRLSAPAGGLRVDRDKLRRGCAGGDAGRQLARSALTLQLTLPGPAGPLEALLEEPALDGTEKPIRAAVAFAHPHPQQGGTMHTKAVYQGAKGLVRIGCAVLRFNFRGVGASAGEFDAGQGEREDFLTALTYLQERYPGRPLWAAG